MHATSFELRRTERLGDDITPLVVEAEIEGHQFMRRLRDDWLSGKNRFEGAGEFLLSGYVAGQLAAVGGLNDDPYCSNPRVGRLRHLYVSPSFRRLGLGSGLVTSIIQSARQSFDRLRLRTDTAEAAIFYERLGFVRIDIETATHTIELRPLRPQPATSYSDISN